ncbi:MULTISPECIES: ABC transporter ATP-binding protein [Streptosporangium]|uniref:ABC transporter related protein n=1 Tax=Streptosporangium roseum (strain ATCC 12428 / DSM 43021 / JCM 3005 / KCTC 9067 / NCIMB 10171 / NRRL 2505 / NI 9100) TaxID=479432 RepID=D2B561_STRRD|nr:ABC transporter ATP-binding protein [Streptosporangium roseum]ACZ87585.1 ABC transporter related protein [Streptosporangium roseum DSM 43021]
MTVIEVEDLRKNYGNTRAVDGVSFTVARGETFGVLGHNGAGKTTTVECLVGLRKPDSGTIRVLGENPARRRRALAQRTGVQLQQGELPDRLRVAEAMRLFAAFYDRPDDWRAVLERWGLGPIANKAFGDLSGGQQQRLKLAMALVGGPELVVLDELTTGLDPVARRETWTLIGDLKASGTTAVLVSHFMDEAEELCDRVAVFGNGRIIALGSPRELIGRTGTGSLEEAYFALSGEGR